MAHERQRLVNTSARFNIICEIEAMNQGRVEASTPFFCPASSRRSGDGTGGSTALSNALRRAVGLLAAIDHTDSVHVLLLIVFI